MASEAEVVDGAQGFDDAAWNENGAIDSTENELQNDTEEQEQETANVSSTHASEDDGEEVEEREEEEADDGGDNEGDEDDDGADYDPESVSTNPLPELSEPAQATPDPTQAKATKPKTSGGFLVGDSDDEDDAPVAEQPPARAGSSSKPETSSTPTTTQGQSDPPSVSLAPPDNVAPTTEVSSTQNLDVYDAAKDTDDIISRLEDRVTNDSRGDMDAWLALIDEYRRSQKVDQLRSVFERFVKVFPQSAEIWVQWIKLELDCMNTTAAETLFQRSLLVAPNVELWTTYINYIRRRNDLTNDPNGQARQVISQSYEFVIDNVGLDRDSGQLWKDWIQFIKSGPGQVGGSGWQDQQKMDQLRNAFHRAITVPMSALTELWKDYDQFELGLNKTTGRQFIQKRSPGYMTAKTASLQLDRKLARLNRTTLPRLPPAPGFAGDQEFMDQVEIWKQWIQWEREDPLVLKEEEPEAYKQRVLYVYKQALMALRFWPEMWVEAAEWCFANNVTKDGSDIGIKLLTEGIEANPESVLLAFKHGDRIEATVPAGDTDEAKATRAKTIRAPYDKVLDTLYGMMQKLKEREKSEVASIEQAAAEASKRETERDDDNDSNDDGQASKAAHQERLKAVKQGFGVQMDLLKRTISFVWIALCRAMRRVQGKGSPTAGLRQVFTEARAKGQLTSDVYVAVALLESVVYKDAAGGKIFDRGAKLFPEDENFMLEYIQFLHSKDDTTNARVVFETCVNRLTNNPEKKHKAKPLYLYFHKYESQFGEISSISALERRMAELWPEDTKLSHFSNRYSVETFDPVAYRLIISPGVQLRPKVIPSIEQLASMGNSPMPASALPVSRQTASPGPQYIGTTASPKRPYPGGDEFEDLGRPRKFARGESPLKGAAGRRLDQQRRNQGAPLSRDITFLLGILPPAHSYNSVRFNPANLVNLVRDTAVPDYSTWKASQDQGTRQSNGMQRSTSGTMSHNRQPSTGEYPAYGGHGAGNRDSPNPRPLSPYDGYGRRVTSQSGYRNSPLRPDQPATFDTPPLAGGYRQDAPQYAQPPASQWPPPGAPAYEGGGGAPPAWAPPSTSYGQPPPQQYGQYQY